MDGGNGWGDSLGGGRLVLVGSVLLAAALVGSKAAQAKALAGQDGADLGALAVEKRSHGAADIDVGIAVAHANVKSQVAGIRGNGEMGGVRKNRD